MQRDAPVFNGEAPGAVVDGELRDEPLVLGENQARSVHVGGEIDADTTGGRGKPHEGGRREPVARHRQPRGVDHSWFQRSYVATDLGLRAARKGQSARIDAPVGLVEVADLAFDRDALVERQHGNR